MKSIWGRQNKPKLKLEINEYGQPCGKYATQFANFVGTQIRTKGFPVEFDDWRKVDLSKKLALWTEAKLFWELDQRVFQWYMKTTQIKWKDFKSNLKRDYYEESYEYDELIASCDDRVHPDQWKKLVDFWLTPKAKACSIRGKKNRAHHTQNHTSESKSFAWVDTEMIEELKRRPHRHELFIETHTHRISGLPQKGSAVRINIRTREACSAEEGNAILEDEVESNATMQNDGTLIGRIIINVEKHDRQQGGGRDVILYSITRPLGVTIAKGTIKTTNPKAVVGGEPLGSQYVEIIIYSVFKRETQLPHPYGGVLTMGDAKGKSIAWPSAMIKDAKKRTNVLGGAGTMIY